MKDVSEFKNIHLGKRVFILASGPSLAELDLTPLTRRITIGLNRSGLAFPDARYHCAMDDRLFVEFEELLRRTRYLFTLEGRPWGIPLKLLGSEGFSWDLSEGIFSGYTIAYFALQLAVYMGFSEIFYLGLDLRLDGEKTHFFGHDYRSAQHEQTEFGKMLKMFEYGAKQLKASGNAIQVFNCSPKCKYEFFPYMSYEDAVKR